MEADRRRSGAGGRSPPRFHRAASAGRGARSLCGDARCVLRAVDRRRGQLLRNRGVVCHRRVDHTPPREPGGRRQGSAGAGMGSGAGRATEIRRSAGRLVPRGWGEAGLSPAEADAHRAFFVQPWQVAVVVGSGDPTVGGVFRRSAGPAWAQECLPFYELIDPSSSRPDGSKPTRLRWDNYRTEETALVPSAALPVPGVSVVPVPAPPPPAPSVAPAWRTSPQQPQVLWPEQFGGAEGATAGGASVSGTRVRRWAAYATAGVLAMAGLFRLYSALA